MQKARLKVSRHYVPNSNRKERRIAKCGSHIYEFDPTYGWHPHGALYHDQAAIDFLTWARWRDGDFCPLCDGKDRIYDYSDRKTHKCGHCRRRFSIKVGTIFHGSKLSVRQWLWAVLMACESICLSGRLIAQRLKVTRKTALAVIKQLEAWNLRGMEFERAVCFIVDKGSRNIVDTENIVTAHDGH